jgi:hypothetical protein
VREHAYATEIIAQRGAIPNLAVRETRAHPVVEEEEEEEEEVVEEMVEEQEQEMEVRCPSKMKRIAVNADGSARDELPQHA